MGRQRAQGWTTGVEKQMLQFNLTESVFSSAAPLSSWTWVVQGPLWLHWLHWPRTDPVWKGLFRCKAASYVPLMQLLGPKVIQSRTKIGQMLSTDWQCLQSIISRRTYYHSPEWFSPFTWEPVAGDAGVWAWSHFACQADTSLLSYGPSPGLFTCHSPVPGTLLLSLTMGAPWPTNVHKSCPK